MAPAGRPKIGKEKRRRVNLMLEPSTYEYLKIVGEGSASMGIHLIMLKHMTQHLCEEVKKLPMPKKSKRSAVNQGAKRS